ncbi:D-2-hydroxyacid dehydrogenase [Ornithinibacillus scapharcae]|uniref:D-2-hydroxyacid dehydrogenase n=1 Tax=Ornithinibacillus scapharcae TaxID=1147159 RepID=UPI000225B8A0|nr:D-2-hydroxyacid dehydrogenase [Ornithinibacillus scapharcae]
MTILFSAKVSDKHQQALQENYPNQLFIFTESMEQAEAHLGQASILVTYGEDLNDDNLAKATNLNWIMVLSAGVERLPFKQIAERNILVTNSRGIHKIQMAEYTISMLLQVYRQEKHFIESEKHSKWDKSVRPNEIFGRTLVVLGTGAIGQEIARIAKAFQMKTIGVSRSGRPVEYFDEVHTMEELNKKLPEADFLVSVLPSTYETRYLLKEEHFIRMKDSAVFVNIGRGDLVDSNVLLYAIQEKQIAHAILDVFEQEPLPADSPFWKESNITVTPHISGSSPNYMSRALDIFQDNLDKFQKGETDYQNIVDPKRGY